MNGDQVVIVGAGAAGTAAAVELHRTGFAGPVTILNGEDVSPYNRTTVNKTLLQAEADHARVGQPIPDDDRTRVITGNPAVSADLAGQQVQLADGSVLGYDALLVASGARPRPLEVPVPDAVRSRVTTLRTAREAKRVREVLHEVQGSAGRHARVVIMGASLLGSETADALTALGHEVHLVDRSPAPLTRLLGSAIGTWVDDEHRARLGAVLVDRVASVSAPPEGEGVLVHLAGGQKLTSDLLIVAAGVEADTGWLAGTPLDGAQGVATDHHLRALGSSQVYAAGDVARIDGGGRTEHWGQALAQGAHAARSLAHDLGVGGDPGPFGGVSSYSTRLYGKAVSVIGSATRRSDVIELLHDREAGLHVTAFVTRDRSLDGLVVLGPTKIANKLRPLVAGSHPLQDAAEVLHALGMQPLVQPAGAR